MHLQVLDEAKRSAEVTHNHPEGIKGARATASAIFMARQGRSKKEIKEYIISRFSYDLSKSLDEIRASYNFDVSCQGSVPVAITVEDAVRKAVSVGGDSDTIACITGGIAQAFYREIPREIVENVKQRLTPDMLSILEEFINKGDKIKCQV